MKSMKKIIAVMMTVLLLMSTVSVTFMSSAAKKKVTKVKLDVTSLTLYVGQTYKFTTTVKPKDAANKKVSWSSSNKNIVTVNSKGKITAVKKGTATITCKAKDGSGKKATCKITVKKKVTIKSLSLNKTSLSLLTGQTATLTPKFSPTNASNKNVTWKSSNTNVAKVNANGKITAVNAGTATITCTSKDNKKKKATCKVTVTKKVNVTGVTLNKTSASVVVGGSVTLKATVSPSNATTKGVTWSSSNTKVATVNASGKVTAVAAGTATITCKTNDQNKKATCKVTVTPVKVSGITLSKTSAVINKGASITLTATVAPTNAANKSVTWVSSNTKVVTVNASGKITAVGAGTANVTCTAKDGSKKSATCKVTVTVPTTGITIKSSTTTYYKGSSFKLTATVTPSDATNKGVTWKSSNTELATVDANGNVKIIGYNNPGLFSKSNKVTITATSNANSKVTKEFSFVVTQKVNVEDVQLDSTKNSKIYFVGNKYQIYASVTNSDASNKTLTYTVIEGKDLATVNASGMLTAVKAGKVTVRVASADNSTKYKDLTITIYNDPSLTITVSGSSKTDRDGKKYYKIGDELQLRCVPNPTVLTSVYGIVFEVSDPSSISTFSQIDGYPNYANLKFNKSGTMKVRAKTTGGEVISDWVEFEVRELKVEKDFYENVKKGDTFEIYGDLYSGSTKVKNNGNLDIATSTSYTDCIKIDYILDGDRVIGAKVTIINDLDESGANIYLQTSNGSDFLYVYFIPGTYEIPQSTSDRFALMKQFSTSMNNASFNSDYDKSAYFNNIKVDDSKSSSSINIKLGSLPLTIPDSLMGDIMEEASAESFVKEMFTEPYVDTRKYVGQTDLPDPIGVSESDIDSITVTDNGATYDIQMNLKSTGKISLSSVASSSYAKMMPVIDKNYLDKYIQNFTDINEDSLNITDANYGTVNETYKNGYVVYTVNKFTNKVVDATYHYTAAMDVTNAGLNIDATMDGGSDGPISLGLKIKATFTMDVDTTLKFNNISY